MKDEEWRRSDEYTAETENALDLPSRKIEGVVILLFMLTLIADQVKQLMIQRVDATSSFPGAYVVVTSDRQGFLTPGSNALCFGLPNPKGSVTIYEAAQSPVTVAGTAWVFHPLPLYSSRNTCDGQPVLRVDAIYLCSKDQLRERPTLSRILETHKRV